MKKLNLVDPLKKEACDMTVALQAIETKRATYYRWLKNYSQLGVDGLHPKSRKPKHHRPNRWSKALRSKIYQLRKQYPCYGKAKIHRLLVRDHQITDISSATIGRIIQHFIRLNKVLAVANVDFQT